MSKPTPILVLDNSFTFGGAINSLCHLFRALDKKRFAPVLVTGQPPEFLEKNFPDCHCYHSVPKLPWIDNHLYRRVLRSTIFRNRTLLKVLNLLRFIYWIAFVTLPEALKYYRLGRTHQVALVHLNNIFGSQLAGILAAKFLRVPCVAHLRDFEEVHPVTRFYARFIDHHVAISEAVKRNLLQLGVPEEKISVVHDALDLREFNAEVEYLHLFDEFRLTPDQPRFGIFGRVVEWKGIREFLHAACRVIKDVPAARAFIVGSHSDGEESFFQQMQQQCADLGLEGQVIFTGYRKDVPAFMRFMDVVVHASNRPEPFGMVIIEGMAMSKPVVATRGGGPLDIVAERETGYLVEMGDAKAMGSAIAKLLKQPSLRQWMGSRCRIRVENMFSNDLYASKMELIFQSLIKG